MKKTSEVLAPVGNWEMCHAAVHNGADAIYVGMPKYNARGRTVDLSHEELQEMIQYCHLYGVKVFVAFNILIFQKELEELLDSLIQVLRMKPDAMILQDLGLARLVRFLSPKQVIHASTQMTMTNEEGITFVEDLGFDRFVLGREVSIDEMALIREKTEKELEVFVHGALCVAYSGQCLTSERVGGRSANRGQCAQSCRLEYDLMIDGKKRDLGSKRYLVSPKDLCGVEEVPRLMELGIDSFKIEGRLKAPEYVASTTRNYKQKILHTKEGTSFQSGKEEMKIAFSRDFFTGWLNGVDHQELVDGSFSSHRGLQVGRVLKKLTGKKFPQIELSSSRKLVTGDGLLFFAGDTRTQIGGKIYEILHSKKQHYTISLSSDFPFKKLKEGCEVFLNRSPQLDKQEQQTWKDHKLTKRIPLSLQVQGELDQPLILTAKDDLGHQVIVQSGTSLLQAQKAPLDPARLQKELGALGGTCFRVEQFDCDLKGELFIHNKEVKNLRREATELLQEQRRAIPEIQVQSKIQTLEWLKEQSPLEKISSGQPTPPAMHVLVRHKEQLAALEGLSVQTVYLDFEHGNTYDKAVQQIREMGMQAGICTTRIFKAGKYRLLKMINRIQPDAVLIRNLGALRYFQEQHPNTMPFQLVGDFSLNVTNHLSANYLLAKGLDRLCPSYDLNRPQLNDLLDVVSGCNFEITVHQYMPSFHMEHCVFAAFLSKGSSIKDCGMPCQKNPNVSLMDGQGIQHPLKADQECRNTMFNGVPQSAASLMPFMMSQGIRHFRLEALNESPEALRKKVQVYLQVMNQKEGQPQLSAEELFQELGIMEKYGVSEGQLHSTRHYHDRKKVSTR